VVAALALVLAAAFGAGDQYLGSMSWHPWAADVSLLSAPWLLLPFVAGCTQRRPGPAALLGLACTASALLGYGLMTLSPVENAHLTARTVAGFLQSERPVLLGALVTGPLFGWLGQRWRSGRATVGALAVAAAFSLEPLARVGADRAIRFRAIWIVEVAVGVALAVVAARRALRPAGRR
jgi:hypothetical protein